MNEPKMTIKELPSGTVDIVFNGIFSVLQFNCNCSDALPMCKAMCCRMRTNYNVELKANELEKFDSQQILGKGDRSFLPAKPDASCLYLTDESLCEVHNDKPENCITWHCSPGGVGDRLIRRDAGWLLSPFTFTPQI